MTKRDKLVQKMLSGKSISSDDAEKILILFGYQMVNREGSHVTYGKQNKILLQLLQIKRR